MFELSLHSARLASSSGCYSARSRRHSRNITKDRRTGLHDDLVPSRRTTWHGRRNSAESRPLSTTVATEGDLRSFVPEVAYGDSEARHRVSGLRTFQEKRPVDGLGELTLLGTTVGNDFFRLPGSLEVHYDLRSLMGLLADGEVPCLAVFDVSALWRLAAKKSTLGEPETLLRAAESPEAFSCLATNSGALRPIQNLQSPGKAIVSVRHLPCEDGTEEPTGESKMLMRILVTREPEDPQEWWFAGPVVVIRTQLFEDTAGVPLPMSTPAPTVPDADPRQLAAMIGSYQQAPSKTPQEPNEGIGVKLQDLLDFHEAIKPELSHYCRCHRTLGGDKNGFGAHVCLEEPCPYASVSLGHGGHRFVSHSQLTREDRAKLKDMILDMRLVRMRYSRVNRIPQRPQSRSGHRSTCSQRSLQERSVDNDFTFVSYCWSEPFAQLLDTLQRAMDSNEFVFLPGLMSSFDVLPPAGDDPRPEHRRDALQMLSLPNLRRSVLVVDRACDVVNCAQSSREVSEAWQRQLPIFVWPHRQTNLQRLQRAFRLMPVEHGQPVESQALAQPLDKTKATEHVRNHLQVSLGRYAAALEAATTFKSYHHPTALRLLPELEFVFMMKDLRKRTRYCLDILEGDFQSKIEEIEKVKNSLEEERRISRQKQEVRQMVRGNGQCEAISMERCNELAGRVCDLQRHLSGKESGAKLKKSQLRNQVQDLTTLEEEIREQRQRAHAARERRANAASDSARYGQLLHRQEGQEAGSAGKSACT